MIFNLNVFTVYRIPVTTGYAYQNVVDFGNLVPNIFSDIISDWSSITECCISRYATTAASVTCPLYQSKSYHLRVFNWDKI